MTVRIVVAALALVALLGAVVSSAASTVKRPCPVPQMAGDIVDEAVDAGMVAALRQLRGDFAALDQRAAALEQAISSHDAACTGVPGSRVATCTAQRNQIETDWGVYEHDLAAYAASRNATLARVRQAHAQAIARLDERMRRSRREIATQQRSIDLAQREAEDWVALGEHARQDSRDQALQTIYDLTLDRLIRAKRLAGARTVREVRLEERWQKWLIALRDVRGLNHSAEYIAFLERQLASARDDLRLLVFVQTVSRTVTLTDLAALGLERSSDNERLKEDLKRLLADSMEFLLLDLQVAGKVGMLPQLLIADLKLGAAAGYGWWAYFAAKARVDDLALLEKREIENLKRLSALYVADAARRRVLERRAEDLDATGRCP